MDVQQASPLAGPEYDRDTPLEERLRLRLATLRANRERFIADAQRQIAALDAAIAELDALLDPEAARAAQAAQASQNGRGG